MPVQPEPVLIAAARWLERLPRSSVPRCRAIFTTLREFSDITPTQYESALTWLQRAGLLDDVHSITPPAHRVFAASIDQADNPWLVNADALIQGPDDLPQDATRAASALGLDLDSAFAHVVTAWRKVDTAIRTQVGAAGEAALAEMLREFTIAQVDQVSLRSDGYGYDISLAAPAFSLHAEVKTSTRRERLSVFLSRNEFETMHRDASWQLIAVRLSPDLKVIDAIATVGRSWITSQAPADAGMYGRWESFRLEVPPSQRASGIPNVRAVLAGDAPPVLTGEADW